MTMKKQGRHTLLILGVREDTLPQVNQTLKDNKVIEKKSYAIKFDNIDENSFDSLKDKL